MLKIKKTIEIKIEKKKNNFYCPSNREVSFLLGTSSATSNPHVFSIKRENKMWVIPVSIVKEREKELKKIQREQLRQDNYDKAIKVLIKNKIDFNLLDIKIRR